MSWQEVSQRLKTHPILSLFNHPFCQDSYKGSSCVSLWHPLVIQLSLIQKMGAKTQAVLLSKLREAQSEFTPYRRTNYWPKHFFLKQCFLARQGAAKGEAPKQITLYTLLQALCSREAQAAVPRLRQEPPPWQQLNNRTQCQGLISLHFSPVLFSPLQKAQWKYPL